MKTFAFFSHKGGTGKSTLAIHLAVQAYTEGLEVLLVDLDHHSATVAEWASIRTQNQPVVVTASPSDIPELKQQAMEEGFDLLMLDCSPYYNDDTMRISELADITIIPTAPRFAEISSLPKGIDKVQPPLMVVLNSCTPDNQETVSFKTVQVREILEEHNIPVSHVHVTRLEAFTESLNYGQGVAEYQPDGKASIQVKALLEWLNQPPVKA